MKKNIIILMLLSFSTATVYCQIEKINVSEINNATKQLKMDVLNKFYKELTPKQLTRNLKIFPLILILDSNIRNQNLNKLMDTSNLGIIVFDKSIKRVKYYLKGDNNIYDVHWYVFDKHIFDYTDSATCYVMTEIKRSGFFILYDFFDFFVQKSESQNVLIDLMRNKYHSFDSMVLVNFGTITKFNEIVKFKSFKSSIFEKYSFETNEGAHAIIANSWPLKCKYFPDEEEKIINAYLALLDEALHINQYQKAILKSTFNEYIISCNEHKLLFKGLSKAPLPTTNATQHYYKYHDFYPFIKNILTPEQLKDFEFYFWLFCPENSTRDLSYCRASLYELALDRIHKECNGNEKEVEKIIKEIVKKSMKQY